MNADNEGRNDNRIPNSNARCLLENWFEERKTKDLDPEDLDGYIYNRALRLKHGHGHILTHDASAPVAGRTVTMDSYQTPVPFKVRTKGMRAEKFENYMIEKYGKEEMDLLFTPTEPTDYRTMKKIAFDKPELEAKLGQLPPSTKNHDYKTEQAISFWTDNRDRREGVTNRKTKDVAFRKNSSFTAPVYGDWENSPAIKYDDTW